MTLTRPDHADIVGFHARRTPGRVAIRDLTSGRSLTYGELDDEVARLACVLTRTHGARIGDRIAWLSKNSLETVVAHLACGRAGLIFTPLNWRLTTLELKALIADCEPRLLIGDGQLAAHGLLGLSVDRLWSEVQAADPEAAALAPVDPERPSLILYTSGTSGRAKGALGSERYLEAVAHNFGLLGEVDEGTVFLIDSPMFHVIGLVTSVRPALLQGGTLLVSDGFDPGRTLARLADPALGVTHYFCVPQMAIALRRHETYDPAMLKGLKALFTGGAPHPADDICAFLDQGVPIVDGYGMSEAGTVFGMPIDLGRIRDKAGSVGYGSPSIGARIMRADGEAAAIGEAGELELRGPNLFSGYWRRPEETAAAYSVDGWFRTGDIAVRDGDGFYRLVDRKKDMFISGGENVYPAEIEAALADLPDLVECAVVGVPDERWGEVGGLFLVEKAGRSLDDAHVADRLTQRLARYKIPKYLWRLDRLPRNGAGKVLKTVLREEAARLAGLD
jgi:fatty-acyl-CoA synthase